MLAAAQTTGPAAGWERGEPGDTLIVSMRSAPYPHPSREQGFKIGEKVFPREPHYVDDSVALFVPRGFRPTDRTDVLVYLHGHYNNIRKAMTDFRIREQIAASGRNVILIFPEGPKDAGDSGCGKLEEPGGLRRLVEEALATLHARGRIHHERIGRVLLAGHSGAYFGISYCLEHGGCDQELSDVCLLDASYARLDAFVDWVKGHPQGRFFSIFTDHLAAKNVYLMTHLRQNHVEYTLMAEQDAGKRTAGQVRVLFLHAEKLNHNGTVAWLERWLATRPIPGTRPSD